jgi:hypothetical protein
MLCRYPTSIANVGVAAGSGLASKTLCPEVVMLAMNVAWASSLYDAVFSTLYPGCEA